MFKFNFNNDEQAPVGDSDLIETGENSIQWHESKEVKIPLGIADSIQKIPRNQIITIDYNCGLVISCLSANEALTKLKEKSGNEKVFDVLKADEKHSDLLPGEYEGGLKVWECTKDIVLHFMNNEIKKTTNSLHRKSILDLGCGSGILGIMCLLHGASVTFQDYNEEVLEEMTIPNIILNCNNVIKNKVRLFSGDWLSFLNLINNNGRCENSLLLELCLMKHQNNLFLIGQEDTGNRFDYILTCETIYNPQNYKKIIMIFKKLLKPGGICFVAAKMNYFGVGGSLKVFQDLLQEQGMMTDLCWESAEGVARGILKVWFP